MLEIHIHSNTWISLTALWFSYYHSKTDKFEYLLYDFNDEIVEPFSFNFSAITRAYRTAICKAKRGSFKDTLPDDLLASVLKVIL